MKQIYFSLLFLINFSFFAQFNLERRVTLAGTPSTNPSNLIVFNNQLFFSGSNLFPPAVNTQVELHSLVSKDASPIALLNLDGSASARVDKIFTMGGSLFFKASNFTGLSPQLYKYEGKDNIPTKLTSNSLMGTNFGGSGTALSSFVIKPNYFLFEGKDDVNNSSTLWKYENSSESPQKIATFPTKHFASEIESNGLEYLGIYNDIITYFVITNSQGEENIDELWVLDDNENDGLKNTGFSYQSISDAFINNGDLYFNAFVDNKGELYKYDHETKTQTKITNNTLADGTNPKKFSVLNNTLLFSGSIGNTFYEQLIKIENGTVESVKNLYIESEFLKKDGKIYFYGRDSNYEKSGIWESDGTTEGTKLVLTNDGSNIDINGFSNATIFENETYFLSNNRDLWVTNFDPINTKKLTSFSDNSLPNSVDSSSDFTKFDGRLWFSGLDSEEGAELWSVKRTEILNTNLSNKYILNVIPNPVADFIYFKNISNPILKCALFDLNGKKLISKTFKEGEQMLDISSVSQGIYFLNVKTEIGIQNIKIIKN